MRKREIAVYLILIAAFATTGCQSPTDPDDVISYDDVIDVTVSPTPVLADTNTGGRTYRVVRGNSQPDEILPYDWHAVFNVGVQFNSQATDDDVDVAFPVRISATTVTVKQASGGIVTTPTGGETEKFEFITSGASSNQAASTNTPVTLTFEVWYDLPSMRREAVITLAFSFVDDDGVTFQRTFDVSVAP